MKKIKEMRAANVSTSVKTPARSKTKKVKKDIAESYNHWKMYKGSQYTGMKICRGA